MQVDILKHESAWFPLKNPALVTMPLSFLAGAIVSLLTPNAATVSNFAQHERDTHLGAH
jgi:cation/acetate symporter